jgi:hypothetical protein
MYKLHQDGAYANKVGTLEWHNVESSAEYLAWLAAGNTPQPADPPPAPDYSALRRAAYAAESDPIFFMAQRGEATQQEWLDKVVEIKARWPA